MMIDRLAVIGVGLIGGSLAMSLRRAGVVGEIVGCGRQRENLELARARGIIDRYEHDAARAVAGADMVVVSVSLAATGAVLSAINPSLGADTVVTDVGSVKGAVIDQARTALDGNFANFVPGHPIAGTEQSGASAAFATLYKGHKVILTPTTAGRAVAVGRVREMWESAGAAVIEMDADRHDAVLAATSHLPHVLAYALVDALGSRDDADSIFEFAAGGFRDFTRIASSNGAMWTEICMANRQALIDVCGGFAQRFEQLTRALEAGDEQAILAVFSRARETREKCIIPEANDRD